MHAIQHRLLSAKSGKATPDESKIEFEEDLRAKHFTLSADVNTSNWAKRTGSKNYLTEYYIGGSIHEKLLEAV